MHIITSIKEMQQWSLARRKDGKLVGFVPTMGFLHDGHISLVHESVKKSDVTVVSIFVNPTQFSATEDLSTYPRDFERDKNLLVAAGADVIFFPDAGMMYPDGFETYIIPGKTSTILEGESRPTHFRGVATVVSILFNAVLPDFAFFGQKDAQQCAVITRMTKDLAFPVQVVICPVVRESDGLAMSSRNVYLSETERKEALVLNKSLTAAKNMIFEGERRSHDILHVMNGILKSVPSASPDYTAIVQSDSFEKSEILESGKEYFVLVACRIGKTRLIDNILILIP